MSPVSAISPTRVTSALFPCEPDGVLFAHQGGWDEALFVLVPLGIFAFLLTRAGKRADREAADADPPDTTPT